MSQQDQTEIPEAVRQYVAQLHAVVDQLLEPLHQQHANRLQCRIDVPSAAWTALRLRSGGCRIRSFLHGHRLAPAPVGRCAMLDETGACRVYEVRPYVCRSQGLPLRWGETSPEGPVEHRDICPLNEAGPALETLPADQCWALGPIESRLAHAQQTAQEARGEPADGPLKRVRLRSLLEHSGD